jgi:hypothetical protein
MSDEFVLIEEKPRALGGRHVHVTVQFTNYFHCTPSLGQISLIQIIDISNPHLSSQTIAGRHEHCRMPSGDFSQTVRHRTKRCISIFLQPPIHPLARQPRLIVCSGIASTTTVVQLGIASITCALWIASEAKDGDLTKGHGASIHSLSSVEKSH